MAFVEPCLCTEHKPGLSPYSCYIQKCKIQIVSRITIKDLILLLPQKDIHCCDQIIYFKKKCIVKIYEEPSNTMCTSNN